MKAYNLDTARQHPGEVTELYLHHCGLTEVPEVVWHCPHLRKLEITGNQLQTLPAAFGELRQLEYLSLAGNKLEQLPGELAFLPQLHYLDLSDNRFESLPEALLSLTGLRFLSLKENMLAELPSETENWQQLEQLDLSENQLKRLPVRLGHLRALRDLRLSGNRLRSLPQTLGRLRQLQRLEADNNRLKGLPSGIIDGWRQLERLQLSGNRLAEIPENIRHCAPLAHLLLNDNRLEQLPAETGELSWLRRLEVRNNKLTSLPESLGQCRFLQQLDVSENTLREIPATLARCDRLEQCSLRRNALRDLPLLPSGLRRLDLSHNELAEVPDTVVSLKQLRQLDLGYNEIESLPGLFGQLHTLQELRLSGNPIRDFPTPLLQLDSLEQLRGAITGKARERLLRLLSAFRQQDTPSRLRPALYRIFNGEEQVLATFSLEDLRWGLRFPIKELRLLFREHLIRKRGARRPLGQGAVIAVAGSIPVDGELLVNRLDRQGMSLVAPGGNGLTHLVLGEQLPEDLPLDASLTFLDIATLNTFLRRAEGRLPATKNPQQLERLRQLLLHPEPANVRLALQLLRGSGAPPALLTDLFFVWKTVKNRRLKKDLRQLLELHLPEEDRRLLSLRLGLSPSLPHVQLEQNILRFGQGKSIDERRLRELVRARIA